MADGLIAGGAHVMNRWLVLFLVAWPPLAAVVTTVLMLHRY